MTEDYTLSLSQIAQQLNNENIDIAESTVRKYARFYKEFLPSRKLEGVRWEKYPLIALKIIRRIFTLSEAGKSRHEIKAMLNQDGYGKILEGVATAVNDTANEPAQPYDNTPSTAPSQHSVNIPELPVQYSDMIAQYNASVMREAAESLRLYHRLMEEKNFQIQELEMMVARLKKEQIQVKAQYQAKTMQILGEVQQWQKQKTTQKASLKKPTPESIG